MLSNCVIKEKFIGFGTPDGMCPYKYPECQKKVEVCYYLEKTEDLYMDARAEIAAWRAESEDE